MLDHVFYFVEVVPFFSIQYSGQFFEAENVVVTGSCLRLRHFLQVSSTPNFEKIHFRSLGSAKILDNSGFLDPQKVSGVLL